MVSPHSETTATETMGFRINNLELRTRNWTLGPNHYIIWLLIILSVKTKRHKREVVGTLNLWLYEQYLVVNVKKYSEKKMILNEYWGQVGFQANYCF